MKKDLRATEIIRTYIDDINELVEKESWISQLQLITDYSNNLNSLLNKSKAKISSQIRSSKNVGNLCDEPVNLNKQSTFGNNTFSSFNSFKTKKQNEKNKIELITNKYIYKGNLAEYELNFREVKSSKSANIDNYLEYKKLFDKIN